MTPFETLFKPSSQPGDWYGWTTNQAGHFAVVGYPAALMLLGVGIGPAAVPLIVAGVYALVWEGWLQGGPDWRDGATDTAHVAAGAACLTAALSWGYWATLAILILWAAMLAAGIRRRL